MGRGIASRSSSEKRLRANHSINKRRKKFRLFGLDAICRVGEPPRLIEPFVGIVVQSAQRLPAIDRVSNALLKFQADPGVDLVILLFPAAAQNDAGDAKLFALDS